MSLTLLFLSLLFLAWSASAGAGWLAVAALRRGADALLMLPASLVGGWSAALVLPLVGLDDGTGVLLSLPAALAGGLVGACSVIKARAIMGRRSSPCRP
ncbi:MAG: hypothetical protein GEU28_08670 [Dehalococcoidia bacterium]|nr:hypothetical protein [Dehalococcoidia bacterium]